MAHNIQLIKVDLGKRSYKIIIGQNILSQVGKFVKKLNIGESIFIITDTNVGKLYANDVIKSFNEANFKDIGKAEIPVGEQSKSFKIYHQVLSQISTFDKYQLKKVVIVVLGGGVVGDLGGFIAGTYKRGVSYIQIPTTLLSQVDSSIGGKVGIDLPEGKNLVGLFWQPKLVYIDIFTLKTLPQREFNAGLAEVVKYGVIKDRKLFTYLEKKYDTILQRDYRALTYIISTCSKIKAETVEKDELDTKDVRIVLNFGHTIGHAIESTTNYRHFLHGEAISIGMVCAGKIAHQLGIFAKKNLNRIENLLKRMSLPTEIKNCSNCTVTQILNSMRYDKKFIYGRNRFVLPVEIGKVTIKEGIDTNLIKKVLVD